MRTKVKSMFKRQTPSMLAGIAVLMLGSALITVNLALEGRHLAAVGTVLLGISGALALHKLGMLTARAVSIEKQLRFLGGRPTAPASVPVAAESKYSYNDLRLIGGFVPPRASGPSSIGRQAAAVETDPKAAHRLFHHE